MCTYACMYTQTYVVLCGFSKKKATENQQKSLMFKSFHGDLFINSDHPVGSPGGYGIQQQLLQVGRKNMRKQVTSSSHHQPDNQIVTARKVFLKVVDHNFEASILP